MTEEHADEDLNFAVYLGLLGLTVATLGAALLGKEGRLMAVSIALIIASAKAGLIALYYMNLRRERLLMYVIVGIGLLAVGLLMVGILPDVAFFPR